VRDSRALLGIEGVEDGVGHRFDGMCDGGLWMERGNPREPVDNVARRLWRRAFSARAARIRLLVIPGELASGGEIRRRRSLGIFLSVGRVFMTDALSTTC
jgi:hypothetical protein